MASIPKDFIILPENRLSLREHFVCREQVDDTILLDCINWQGDNDDNQMGGSADIHTNKRDGTSQYGETSDTERAEYAHFIFVKNIIQP